MKNNRIIIYHLFAWFLGTLSVLSCGAPIEGHVNGTMWKDTEGFPINAHGGGILRHGDRYYWYGEYKEGKSYKLDWVTTWDCWRTDAGGVSCYSSKDLANWQFEGIVLAPDLNDESSDLHPSQVIERPKVLYNEQTGQFVMWMHIESPDYEKAHAGVAVSDSPTGPFTYLGSFKPNGADSRDQTLFKDDDGRAYQIYSSEWNKTLYIGLLDETYTKHTGVYTRNFEGASREAPAVFKHEGKYYLLTSGCTGWDPNVARCAMADSLLGEWTWTENPCKGPDAENTFHAQDTFVLPIPSGQGDTVFVAMFDRWKKEDLAKSGYIWLPVTFSIDGAPVIEWQDRWTPPSTNSEESQDESPTVMFNNWSAYDQLSDHVPLTEELSMDLLDAVLRFRENGGKVDAYMMDAFWFDKDGGYRIWDRERWPDGPQRWIQSCLDNGITPGLWFSTNLIMSGNDYLVKPTPSWKGSQTSDPAVLSLFEGDYLEDLMSILQDYTDRGIGIFKFDFAYFDAASDNAKSRMTREEIIFANKKAFHDALAAFRSRNPDVRLIAYNGFGGNLEHTSTPFGHSVQTEWLDVFDTMYSGDPRFSDVPMVNLWRTEDLYSDHQVRQFFSNGVPLERIDNCSLMLGQTGTNYRRGTAAWKSSALLNMARGGRLNVIHGSIDLLDDLQMKWFARAQNLFLRFQEKGYVAPIGGVPGREEVYGYRASDQDGSVVTLVNPTQRFVLTKLPFRGEKSGRILFTDAGCPPVLRGDSLSLGPEQMAVVGFGEYANPEYDLGLEDNVVIPSFISPIIPDNYSHDRHGALAEFRAPSGTVRVLFRQLFQDGTQIRTWADDSMDLHLHLIVHSEGEVVPLRINYDKVIWSGLSWASGEFEAPEGSLISISGMTDCPYIADTRLNLYQVKY